MHRTEINVVTGETTSIPLTPEEIADAQAATAAEVAEREAREAAERAERRQQFLDENPDIAALLAST